MSLIALYIEFQGVKYCSLLRLRIFLHICEFRRITCTFDWRTWALRAAEPDAPRSFDLLCKPTTSPTQPPHSNNFLATNCADPVAGILQSKGSHYFPKTKVWAQSCASRSCVPLQMTAWLPRVLKVNCLNQVTLHHIILLLQVTMAHSRTSNPYPSTWKQSIRHGKIAGLDLSNLTQSLRWNS